MLYNQRRASFIFLYFDYSECFIDGDVTLTNAVMFFFSSARGFGVLGGMHVVLWLVLILLYINLRASLHNNLHASLALRSHNGWSGQSLLVASID